MDNVKEDHGGIDAGHALEAVLDIDEQLIRAAVARGKPHAKDRRHGQGREAGRGGIGRIRGGHRGGRRGGLGARV